jgi:RNA polymerase sigma-70 factor (ECF subfamily)
MRNDAVNEAEIIARICAGEKELFHALIVPYERAVYLTVLSLLKSEAEAEDAAQDAFVKAYRYLNTFRADSRFSTWLISIALNEARSRLRKASRVAIESLDEYQEEHEGDFTPALLTDWREIPSEALERRELQATIRSAVEELPLIYREVLVLRDLEERDPAETAELLGISSNLVKVRLHRARMMLQKRLVPALKSSAPRQGFWGRKSWS